MCLLVYPKTEKQVAVLQQRIQEIKKNPKIGISYQEVVGKIKKKYSWR